MIEIGTSVTATYTRFDGTRETVSGFVVAFVGNDRIQISNFAETAKWTSPINAVNVIS